jgi:lipoprotein NlpD
MIPQSRSLVGYVLLIMLLMTGCQAVREYSVKGPGWYRVKPTDTLYSIAWRYALDYRDLASWNDLSEPYHITPGQQLLLVEPSTPEQVIKDKRVVAETTASGTSVVVKSLAPEYNRAIRWRWPTKGKVVNRFSSKALGQHGIDIAGKLGQPVYAVADGKVVYSGTGLADYGNLIIVKHNDTFLSAYAYNRKRLVKEGTWVKRGTQIAEMGSWENNIAALHFQIRKDGEPVDPLLYLPQL